MLKRLLILGVAALCGCASLETPKYAVAIKEVDWPLLNLQKLVVYVLPFGLRSTSRNGREMQSKYFIPEKGIYKPAEVLTDRYYATITVLGDQRPYRVEIFVTHENRSAVNGVTEYVEVGHAEGLANQLAIKMRQELAKRREDRNIIDDFRVF